MKTTVRIIVMIFIFLITTAQLFAQGEFLKRGESGWGVAGSAAISKYSSGYGGALGYSFKSIFDVNIGIGTTYNGDELFSGDDYSNFISYGLTYFIRKQNLNSLAISLNYQSIQKRNFYNAGGILLSISHNLVTSIEDICQLHFSIGIDRTNETSALEASLGLSLGGKVKENRLFIFTPTYGITKVLGKTVHTYGFEIAFIFK